MGPKQILNQANKAALSARSMRLIGTSPQASLDLVVTQDSSDGSRTAGETTLKTRVVDNTIYIKADADYWLSETKMQAAPKDKQGTFKNAMAALTPYIKAGKF